VAEAEVVAEAVAVAVVAMEVEAKVEDSEPEAGRWRRLHSQAHKRRVKEEVQDRKLAAAPFA
jgi:hypothetical protein